MAFAPSGDSSDGRVVVAVESTAVVTAEEVSLRVRQVVTNALGITPAEVIVLPRGGIPLTTSGKLRRAAIREAYARGELEPVGAMQGVG